VNNVVTDWYDQLNLNPALRYAAAVGTSIVQEGQEEYMDRAWDFIEKPQEVHKLVERWNYSMELSQSFYSKRLLPILQGAMVNDENNFLALAFTAPMHQKLIYGDKTFTALLSNKVAPAAYTRSFTKLIRRKGPLMRRLNQQATGSIFFEKKVIAPSEEVDLLL